MKYLFCLFFLLCFLTRGISQNYTRDAGVRLGDGIFASYRIYFDENTAVEGFAGFVQNGFRVAGIREFFIPAMPSKTNNLKFVYGYGIHAGFSYTNKFTFLGREYYHDWEWSPQFGFDGLAGFEYSPPDLPFLISISSQPYFEYSLTKYFKLKVLNVVIGLKYRF